jgi:DNA-binding CsgD family transcriptional regulator
MVDEVSSGTLAGRDSELAAMGAMLDGLETTGARTLLVGGEAGIGKTRLVDELLQRARDAGSLTAVGVCTPSEGGGLAYGPIVGVVRDISSRLGVVTMGDALSSARRALGLDGDAAGAAPAEDANRVQLVEALLACCRSLGDRGRAVLVFEDLHWADSTSLEMIDFLARNLGSSPILIIATYRSDETDRASALGSMVTELVRHRAVSFLELTGLDRDTTASLMREILGSPPEWSLLDAVHARSGGNPFYAEELTAARGTPSLPDTLVNVVLLRTERLSADARTLAATVATAGLSIDYRLLSAACALDEDRLHAATTEAVAGHLLIVDDGARLRFRHALQREAVYESLLPTERTRLHHQVALALSALDDRRAEGFGHADGELAYHWWEAGEWAAAMRAALRAGDAMATLLAIPEAYAQYERALAAYDRCGALERADVDRVDLLIKTSDMAYIAGQTARALELVEWATDEADPDLTPERTATALTMLCRQAAVAGDTERAFAALARAAAILPAGRPTRELALVVAYEAGLRMNMGRMKDATAKALEAIAVARAADARAAECHAECTLGVCLVETGDVENGISHVRRAIDIAEELQLPAPLDRCYGNLSHVLMTAGRLDETARLVKSSTTGEWVTGIRLYAAGQNASEALIRSARFDDATAVLDRMPERGTSSCIYGPHALRALLALRQGRLDDAETHLDAADLLAADQPAFRGGGTADMLRAELLLERGVPDDAYAAIERALTNVAATDDHIMRCEMCALGVRALADIDDAARLRGRTVDRDKLCRLAGALVEQARRDVDALSQSTSAAPPRVGALFAQCAAEATRLDEPDPGLWRAAATAWIEASEPWPMAYCEWREAQAALATNARPDAIAAVTAAWSRAHEIGAQTLVAHVERLAQRARIKLVDLSPEADTPQRAIAQDLGLTAREVEVLDQLARRRTDRQIAESLFISKKTASVHVSNILRKLDAGNRVDAGEIGQRAGLGVSSD